MERQKRTIIFLLIAFFCVTGIQANYRSDIFVAYDHNDMKAWKAIIDQMQATPNKSNALLLELVNYQYGYVAWCIGNKKMDDAATYLDIAEVNVALLEKAKYNLSMVNAYKAAFYGFRIGLNTMLAPFLGHKSNDCAKLAIQLDVNNPFAYVQYGNVQYYMPEFFGGSKKVAIQNYLKAQQIMERNPSALKDDWNYINLLTIIAQAYWDTGDLKTAKAYFEKVLPLITEYDWVKKEKYPQLLKEMKSNAGKK